jgi:hypothetical protein
MPSRSRNPRAAAPLAVVQEPDVAPSTLAERAQKPPTQLHKDFAACLTARARAAPIPR